MPAHTQSQLYLVKLAIGLLFERTATIWVWVEGKGHISVKQYAIITDMVINGDTLDVHYAEISERATTFTNGKRSPYPTLRHDCVTLPRVHFDSREEVEAYVTSEAFKDYTATGEHASTSYECSSLVRTVLNASSLAAIESAKLGLLHDDLRAVIFSHSLNDFLNGITEAFDPTATN